MTKENPNFTACFKLSILADVNSVILRQLPRANNRFTMERFSRRHYILQAQLSDFQSSSVLTGISEYKVNMTVSHAHHDQLGNQYALG